jgi:DGQHR domain-containing protein
MIIKSATTPFIEYQALSGTYGKVSYFTTRTSLRDAAENLVLAPQGSLSFGERIQRTLNQDRIQNEILPYLENNELRFFNSLVCILLPDGDATEGYWDFEEYKNDKGQRIGGLGLLRIAKDVARVILDGQHRYEALRLLWQSRKDDLQGIFPEIDVALTFVVVDNLGRLGKPQKDLRKKTIEAVRNLFAVLNKTARSVDKATLLLIDDTQVTNVMTRKLIEENLIKEQPIKWTGGENLQQADPFFTTLGVIKDAIKWYLRDFSDQLDMDCSSQAERKDAIRKYYDMTPGYALSVREGVPILIQENAWYKNWVELLRRLAIAFEHQPKPTILSRAHAKQIEKVRGSNLCYTVAGQKALFRAVVDTFRDQRPRDAKNLRRIVERADVLFQNGLYSRDLKESNPFRELLFDTRGRMVWAETPVFVARQIMSVALGSKVQKEAVEEEYQSKTGRDCKVLHHYWKQAHKCIGLE